MFLCKRHPLCSQDIFKSLVLDLLITDGFLIFVDIIIVYKFDWVYDKKLAKRFNYASGKLNFFQIAVSPRRFIAKMHFLYTQNSVSEPDHGLFLIHRRKVKLGKTLNRENFESLTHKQLNYFYSKFRLRLSILEIPWIFRLKCCFVEIKDSCKKDFSNT